MTERITAVEAISSGFMTAVSDTQKKSYVLTIRYRTLRELQEGHNALVRLVESGPSPTVRDAVARALYEEHRTMVTGRPPWEKLRDDDLYQKGMKDVAYRDADVALEVLAASTGGGQAAPAPIDQ